MKSYDEFRIYHEIISKKIGPVCSSQCNNATTHPDAKGWVTRQSSKSSWSTFISSLNQLIFDLIHASSYFFIIQFHFFIFFLTYFSQFIFTSVCHLYFLKIYGFLFLEAHQMSRLTRIGFEFGFLKRLASSVTKSTSGYVPIFGYKSDSLWRNPLLRERRNAQYHLMSFCLTPYYIGESLQCI